jgi:hypothetical protein
MKFFHFFPSLLGGISTDALKLILLFNLYQKIFTADALKSTGLAELGYDINRIGSVAASNVSQDYN